MTVDSVSSKVHNSDCNGWVEALEALPTFPRLQVSSTACSAGPCQLGAGAWILQSFLQSACPEQAMACHNGCLPASGRLVAMLALSTACALLVTPPRHECATWRAALHMPVPCAACPACGAHMPCVTALRTHLPASSAQSPLPAEYTSAQLIRGAPPLCAGVRV